MRKLLSILLVFTTVFTLSACTKEVVVDPTAPAYPDADSVEILGSNAVLTAGTYELEATVKPSGASQDVEWNLTENYDGVSIDRNSLIIGNSAIDGSVIRVRVRSTSNRSVFTERKFTLSISDLEVTLISTEAELRAIDTDLESLSKSYKLANDIVLTEAWEPMGVSEIEDESGVVIRPAVPFNGILDGQGYKISGISVDTTGYEEVNDGKVVGFIEQIGTNGVLKNIELEGTIKAKAWSGGVAAINQGLISNVLSRISIETLSSAAGGIVSDNRGRVENCILLAAVKSGLPTTDARSAGLFVNSGDASMVFGDATLMKSKNYSTLMGAVKNPGFVADTTKLQLADTFEGFDTNIWNITNGNYPELKDPSFVEVTQDPYVAFTNDTNEMNVQTKTNLQMTVTISGTEETKATFGLKETYLGVSIDAATGVLTLDNTLVEDQQVIIIQVDLEGLASNETSIKLLNDMFDITGEFAVSDEDDLMRVVNEDRYKTGYIYLENDIILDKYKDFPGISGFTGTFDGKGFAIKGLDFDGAFFGEVLESNDANHVFIKDIEFEGNMTANGISWSGVLTRFFNKGVIENVRLNIVYDYTGTYAMGAFVGIIGVEGGAATDATIRNSVNVGTIISDLTPSGWMKNVGAIAGANNGTVENVFYDKEISGYLAAYTPGTGADTHGRTTVEMNEKATYVGFDETVWFLLDGITAKLLNVNYQGETPKANLTISNSDTLIEANVDYQVNASVTGATDNTVTYSLKEAITGVTVDATTGLVTFDMDAFISNTLVTLVVTLNEDTTVTKEYAVNVLNDEFTKTKKLGISTEEDLMLVVNEDRYKSGYIYLKNDIVLDTYKDFPGISGFTGTFDGKGYAIRGLNFDGAFFGQTLESNVASHVLVKDIEFEGNMIADGISWTGVLSGFFNKGVIENVKLDIVFNYTGTYAMGAFVGAIGADATIKDSINVGTIVSDMTPSGWMKNVGAIAGANNGTLENVFYDLEASGYLAAFTDGTGTATHGKTTVELNTKTTYVDFDETVWFTLDGIYAKLLNEIYQGEAPKANLTISNNDTLIEANVNYQINASVIGATDDTLSYMLKGAPTGVIVEPTTGLVTFDMDTFVNNTVVTVVVTLTEDTTVAKEFSVTVLNDEFTKTQELAISNENDLMLVVNQDRYKTGYIYLENDIVLSVYANFPGISGFTGTFDGRGYAITGLDFDGAFFGQTLESDVASHVLVKNIEFEGNMTANGISWTGVLAGFFNEGVIENVRLNIVYDYTGSYAMGAFTGTIGANATLKNSINVGTIISDMTPSGWMKNVGAIAAAIDGTVTNVFYDNELSGYLAPITNGTGTDIYGNTTIEMNTMATYTGLDITIWNIVDGSVPTLIVQ